jgi:hypothetical protein
MSEGEHSSLKYCLRGRVKGPIELVLPGAALGTHHVEQALVEKVVSLRK